MLMRKINAGISLLTTILLLVHAIVYSVWMLSLGTVEKTGTFMSWALLGLMLAHAIISIDLAISAHSETENHKCRSYPHLNVPTMIQRMSGIVLIVFTGLHVAGAMGFMQPPKLVHAILPALFFTIALMHAAVSTSKAFITLGIGNAKFVKVTDIAVKVICAATWIIALTGFYLYKV